VHHVRDMRFGNRHAPQCAVARETYSLARKLFANTANISALH